MQKALKILSISCAFSLASGAALADIYTCRHLDGSTEITDSPCARGASVVSVLKSPKPQQVALVINDAPDGTKNVQSSRNGASNNSANRALPKANLTARVEPNVQRDRDDVRKRVLSHELEQEEKALTDARAQFNGGNPPALADESQNSPKYLDRRARLSQTVSLQERSVAAIRQELSNVR
jgi:Domain of unknown function (DUF4124)